MNSKYGALVGGHDVQKDGALRCSDGTLHLQRWKQLCVCVISMLACVSSYFSSVPSTQDCCCTCQWFILATSTHSGACQLRAQARDRPVMLDAKGAHGGTHPGA